MTHRFVAPLTAVIALGLGAGSAQAQLQSQFDVFFGNNAVTFDTAQQLAFLDLTITQGRSISEIEADFFTPGGAYWGPGWRHATLEEVQRLALNAGFTGNIELGVNEVVFGPTFVDQLSELVQFLGVTNTTPEGEPRSIGFLEPSEDGVTFPSFLVWDVDNTGNPMLANDVVGPVAATGPSSPSFGWWLVRDTGRPVFQGELTNAGEPFTGRRDLRVRLLHDQAAVEGPVLIREVLVEDGLFSIALPFSDDNLTDARAAVEISVLDPDGSFIPLNPPIKLSPAPRALLAKTALGAEFAGRAGRADSANFATTALNAENAENATNATNATNAANASSADNAATADLATEALALRDVANPVDADDEFRLIRGVVNADGTVNTGSGFTVTKLGVGQYQLDFNGPPGAIPVVTATPFTATPRFISVNFVNENVAQLFIVDGSVQLADSAFSFTVVIDR